MIVPNALAKNKTEAKVKTAIETSLDSIYEKAANAAKKEKAASVIQTAARSKLQRLAEQRSNAPPSTAFEGRGEQDLGGAFNEGIDRAKQIAKQSGDKEALAKLSSRGNHEYAKKYLREYEAKQAAGPSAGTRSKSGKKK